LSWRRLWKFVLIRTFLGTPKNLVLKNLGLEKFVFDKDVLYCLAQRGLLLVFVRLFKTATQTRIKVKKKSQPPSSYSQLKRLLRCLKYYSWLKTPSHGKIRR